MKRFKLNWAIPGLFAMILIIAAVAWIQTQAAITPDPAKLATQCSGCHTMDTHVAQWQESSHKSVACTECHADPGVMGWVQMQIGLVRMQFNHDEVDLSKIATKVPNERCMDCHAREMPWVMQDLEPAELDANGEPIRPTKDQLQFLSATAGHDVHLTMENPVSCTECHANVSHGPGPEKTEEHVAAMHKICLDCHAEKQVQVEVRNTLSCSACHLDMDKVAPADHQNSNFRTVHGDSAKTNGATCTQCHLNPGISSQAASAPHGMVPAIPAGTLKVADGMQDSCAACHGTTMPHPDNWLQSHAKGYNEKPEMCASCHGDRQQGFDMTVTGNPRTLSTTDPTCTTCHAQPMPHPEDWLNGGHQTAGKNEPKTCEQCHSPSNPANPNAEHAKAQYCQDCHLGKFAHPSGYVFKHDDVMANYGNNFAAAGCVQCHSQAPGGANSCASCHTGGLTGTLWHPTGFSANHSATMAQYKNNATAAGCTECHTTYQGGENSCASCHGDSLTGTQWHAADYVATHKNTLAQFGNDQVAAGCTDCHGDTPAQNTCTECHTNGLTNGKATTWHPRNWWIVHAQTTKPSDKESCNKCHSYVEPSCAQCHNKF